MSDDDKNKIDIKDLQKWSTVWNFIDNAIKFSKSKVNIFDGDKEIKIINDDGPGFLKTLLLNWTILNQNLRNWAQTQVLG